MTHKYTPKPGDVLTANGVEIRVTHVGDDEVEIRRELLGKQTFQWWPIALFKHEVKLANPEIRRENE